MSFHKMASALRRSVHHMHRDETGGMGLRTALFAGSLCIWAVMSAFRMSSGGAFPGGLGGGFTLFGENTAEIVKMDREAKKAADEQAERGTREWHEIYEQELRERMKESDMYENWIERIRSEADEYDYDEVSDTYDEGSSTQDDGYDYED